MWWESPDATLSVSCITLNPDCVVGEHLIYDKRATIFVMCFVDDIIFNKEDFISYGISNAYLAPTSQ